MSERGSMLEFDVATGDVREIPTVRVRIAVAVDPDGQWNAAGWSERENATGALVCADDDEMQTCVRDSATVSAVVYFIEADVPLPAPPAVIEGVASPAKGD